MVIRRGWVTAILCFIVRLEIVSHISLQLLRILIMAPSYNSSGCKQATKQIFESVAQCS